MLPVGPEQLLSLAWGAKRAGPLLIVTMNVFVATLVSLGRCLVPV